MISLLKLKEKLFYGWVVVVALFISGMTLVGVQYSFGVFFKSIEAEFSLSRAMTSSVLSISMLVGCAFRVLGGWGLDRYGPRVILFLMGIFTGLGLLLTGQTGAVWQLFITYSLIFPIGTSASYTVSMSTVSRWFSKRRGLALGITSAGPAFGIVIMPPLATQNPERTTENTMRLY
ncbi:MFS transporter, partial [Chloroflexota bacterium]